MPALILHKVRSSNRLVRAKMDALRKALWKFDKDYDDQIDPNELLEFLDSNMPDGKRFDRNLSAKIFQVFDIDRSGKITV